LSKHDKNGTNRRVREYSERRQGLRHSEMQFSKGDIIPQYIDT